MDENKSLVLLDEGADWSRKSRVIAHWTQVNVPESQESIPRKADEQSEETKAEYYAWIYDLGRFQVDGKPLVAFLKVFSNLSYWWMTFTASKSPYASDSPYTVFKLRALERLYFARDCSGLIYCGNNRALSETLEDWCRTQAHPYKRFETRIKVTSREQGVRKWLRKLPHWIQALACLIKSWYTRYKYLGSIGLEKANRLKNDGGITIVNYFPNIDVEKIKRGEYWSRYWESLHPVLDQLPLKVNWVWLYFENSDFQFKEAARLRDACNQSSPEKHRHFFIEEFVTPCVLLQALKLYLEIYRKGLGLKGARKAFGFPGSKMNFFPIMEREWKASLFGNLAMDNAMRMAMFDSMAKILSASPLGLFPWENVPWEMALVSAWRRHNKRIRILASQHSFFRIFDLRLCSDRRIFKEMGGEAMPLPDKLCINNREGLSLIQKTGFPEEKIARVEALRFLELKGRYHIYKKPIPRTERTLLVIMGITDHENQSQFQLLREAADTGALQNYSQVIVKPHPTLSSSRLKPVYESGIELSIKNQPLRELWPVADVVYCAHSTGASWEASWYGIPVIAVGAIGSLNLNLLAGVPRFRLVTSGGELSEQLKKPQLAAIPEEYFFLDEDLKLWKELLQK